MVESGISSHNSDNDNDDDDTNERITKCEDAQNHEKIRCWMQKIYPLADEKVDHLIYPTITYHYSVSSNGRYVYVIGEDPLILRSQLYVWDLHRGVSRRYAVFNLLPSSELRHLYEMNPMDGLLVCRSNESFHIHAVKFDHFKEMIRIQKTIFSCPNSNRHFWSSTRASSEAGIIFICQCDENRNFNVAQINMDGLIRTIILNIRMPRLRILGQPWVHDRYMYLFESAPITDQSDIRFLTGRLVRWNLRSAQMDILQTKAIGNIRNSLPAIQQQEADITPQQMSRSSTLIRRVKHVERHGWVWIIAEFVQLHGASNRYDNVHCEVCVMNMQTLTWHRLDWSAGCKCDELTLDVARCGLVVMLRKRTQLVTSGAQVDSFLLLHRNPDTLLKQSFRALITFFPAWRNLNRKQMGMLGIPAYLLDP